MMVTKIVAVVVALGVLLYVGGLAVLYFGQRQMLFPGAFGHGAPPEGALPVAVTPTEVFTADGEKLRAFWKPPRPGCGLVVSFHGNGSFPEHHAARFASGPWARDGWGVLAIAYRGYPGSTGSPSETGLIEDGRAAFAEARRRAPASPILLHGHSLGAAIAITTAQHDAHYAALFLDAPFASILALAEQRLPFVPVSLLLKDTFRSDQRIGSVHGPVVIVHGTEDDVIPVSEAQRLGAAGPTGTIVETIPGDHVNILGARDATLEPFFQRAIGGCPAP